MKIIEIMTKEPHMLNAQASALEACEKMAEFDCGMLPIGDKDDVVGVITDRDILIRAITQGKDLKTTLVQDIMSSNPIFCEEEDDLEEAIYEMNQHHIRRILVRDSLKTLTGVLSLGDIIRRLHDKDLLGKVFSEALAA